MRWNILAFGASKQNDPHYPESKRHYLKWWLQVSLADPAFRRLFLRVCDDFALPAENRRIAWMSCLARNGAISDRARRLYRQLAGTKGPWRAT